MIYRDQVFLNSTNNAGATGTGIILGFGSSPKTKFSLQVAFYSTYTGNLFVSPVGVTKTSPSSADVNLTFSNDNVNFSSQPVLDWTIPTQTNGDVVYIATVGPYESISVNFNISWGSAVVAIVTIIAMAEEKDA